MKIKIVVEKELGWDDVELTEEEKRKVIDYIYDDPAELFDGASWRIKKCQ